MNDTPGQESPEETQAKTAYWQLRIGNGGWVRVEHHLPDDHWWALVRVAPDEDGRLRIMELYFDDLDTGTPLTSERVRKLPIGRLEDFVNLPEERSLITALLTIEAIDLKRVAARYSTTPAQEPPPLPDRDAVAAARKAARHETSAAVVRTNIENRRPLVKPNTRPYPGSFYHQVAAAYRAAQRQGVGPGPFIAEEAGVPRTTATYWINEARRRGYLGPATKGKTGETGELTVRYTGPSHAIELPLPDGRTLQVPQGGTTQIPIDVSFGLLEQETWEPVPPTKP